jgi:hypothetical protein
MQHAGALWATQVLPMRQKLGLSSAVVVSPGQLAMHDMVSSAWSFIAN